MARTRQYGDPISIPFSYGIKGQVEEISERFGISQAEVIRRVVESGALDILDDQLSSPGRPGVEC